MWVWAGVPPQTYSCIWCHAARLYSSQVASRLTELVHRRKQQLLGPSWNGTDVGTGWWPLLQISGNWGCKTSQNEDIIWPQDWMSFFPKAPVKDSFQRAAANIRFKYTSTPTSSL